MNSATSGTSSAICWVENAEKSAAHPDIFQAGRFGVHSYVKVGQARSATVDLHRALRWRIYPPHHPQERGLSGTVCANDPDPCTMLDMQIHIVKRPYDNYISVAGIHCSAADGLRQNPRFESNT